MEILYDLKDSKERISDSRIQLGSSSVQDGLVNLVPCQEQELVAFKFLKSTELEKLYASMQIANPLLKCSVGQSDLPEFLLVRIFSYIANVGKECLKSPLHFSIVILLQKRPIIGSN
jgi:hypothetical protein